MHTVISPAILYWGTPVLLITTTNEDGTANISPTSSAWWLGHRAVIGLGYGSKTTDNLLRNNHCVLNLPSDNMTAAVNCLARTTGSDPVPDWKAGCGYSHVKDKFAHASLTRQESDLISAPRIMECPVQMECELVKAHPMMEDLPDRRGAIYNFELKVLRVHIEEDLRLAGHPNRVDTDKWRPMIQSFQEVYGLQKERLGDSVLARIGEENYRVLTRSDVVTQGSDTDFMTGGKAAKVVEEDGGVHREMKVKVEDGVKVEA